MYKLLIFHHYNSSAGAGLSLLHILRSLNREHIDVSVCLPHIPGDLNQKIAEMGIRILYCDAITPYMHFSGGERFFLSVRHLKNVGNIQKSKDEIRKVIVQESPDIVAVNSMTLFWIGRIAQELEKKAVCFHRETYAKGSFGLRTKIIKQSLSEHFDAVVFLSHYDIRQTPHGKAHFLRVTDKVDIDAYEALRQEECREELGLPREGNMMLYAGGVAKLKGPMTLLRAAKRLSDPSVKVVFLQYSKPELLGWKSKMKYGIKILLGRNLQYKIDHFVEKNHLQEVVIFRPATDHVEKYFAACDMVVFPSCAPHQARPAYEAGAANKPILITDFENTREFVDETNGWLFPCKDYKALAFCMQDALNNSKGDKTRKNYARVKVENNLATMPKELDILFKQLMENNDNE